MCRPSSMAASDQCWTQRSVAPLESSATGDRAMHAFPKSVLVTGATGGIGLAVCDRLARAGAFRLYGVAREARCKRGNFLRGALGRRDVERASSQVRHTGGGSRRGGRPLVGILRSHVRAQRASRRWVHPSVLSPSRFARCCVAPAFGQVVWICQRRVWASASGATPALTVPRKVRASSPIVASSCGSTGRHEPLALSATCRSPGSHPGRSACDDVEMRRDVDARVHVHTAVLLAGVSGSGRFGAVMNEAEALHRGELQQETVVGLPRHQRAEPVEV